MKAGMRPWPADPQDLLKRLDLAGVDVEIGAGGHLKLRHPKAQGYVTIARTPSDVRSTQNACLTIRRVLGVDLRRY